MRKNAPLIDCRPPKACALTVLDLVVFFTSLSFCISLAYFVIVGGGSANVVISGGGENWVYSMDSDLEVLVNGTLGTSTVRIDKDGARIVSSPCKNQSCVACAPIKEKSQWIACLPNHVIVTIENQKPENPKKETFDAELW
ncbi:MAG: hypothetical protein Ta2G_19790 [Termitinemataceae bacterium]|nr:MAG: hypothetical protein Ta2G_19790 [Termitinemataceae bacterium]